MQDADKDPIEAEFRANVNAISDNDSVGRIWFCDGVLMAVCAMSTNAQENPLLVTALTLGALASVYLARHFRLQGNEINKKNSGLVLKMRGINRMRKANGRNAPPHNL